MSIAEHISGMAGGKHRGISEHMERPEHEKASAGEHDGVPAHLKALHSTMGGKHMHVHQHEGGYTSHHIKEDGKVEGPHDHQTTDELKDHVGQVFNEEEHESPSADHDGLM